MKTTNQPKRIVELGRVVITRGANEELNSQDVAVALWRHAQGDWGDVCKADKRSNDEALQDGERLLSAYASNGTKFWIITEWDRSATTILLPDEY